MSKDRSRDQDPRLQRRLAVALQYEVGQDAAPRLVAKGYGAVAQQILNVAQEAGVPVHEDAELGALLSRLDLGDEIPPELFGVVAEVLAFVYRLNLQADKGI